LIIDALADYANQTGIDLSQNPFVEKLQQSNTPDAIIKLFQEREKAFKEYCDGNQRLINCLSPTVRVLYAFSGHLSETVSLVSHLCIFMPYFLVRFYADVDVILSGPLLASEGHLCRH
jgi:hypothetical protein